MHLTYLIVIALSLIATYTTAQTSPLTNQTVIFCVESDDWAPYTFYQRDNGVKTGNILGYDIDIIKTILDEHQIKVMFKILHFNRCLLKAKEGKNIHVVMSAASTPERTKTYLLSNSYYSVTPTYFYLRKRFPHGLNISKASQLTQSGKVCGRLGYTYFKFGLESENIDRNAVNYNDLMRLLLKGRCTTFLARLEAFAGMALIGEDYLADQRITYQKIPNTTAENMHMLISRQYKYANELKRILDNGFVKLQKSGKAQDLLDKYIDTKSLTEKSTLPLKKSSFD